MPPLQSAQIACHRAFTVALIVICDVIDFGAADQRRDTSCVDLQIDHQAVADIAAAARQTARVVAIALHLVAPRLPQKVAAMLRPSSMTGSTAKPFFRSFATVRVACAAVRPRAHRVPSRHSNVT